MGRRIARTAERSKIAGRAVGGAIVAGLVYDGVKMGMKWALDRPAARERLDGLRRSLMWDTQPRTAPPTGPARGPDIVPPASGSDISES
jgi:hypothetical protein